MNCDRLRFTVILKTLRRVRPILIVSIATLILVVGTGCNVRRTPDGKPAVASDPFRATHFKGTSTTHVQGVCTDNSAAIFWSWTDRLAKTDTSGHELAAIAVQKHHGDLCFHEGRLYVAVNLGAFNMPAGSADSWIFVYDAGSLKELGRHRIPEVVHGAGGVAHHGDSFFVVGGLPKDAPANYIYEYDERFAFKKRHVLESGYTLMGIQTVARSHDAWWLGCYGEPKVLICADDSFRIKGRWDFDAAYGIVGLPDGRMLVARDVAAGRGVRTCEVSVATADPERGLTIIAEP